MTARRTLAIVAAALLCGVGDVLLVLPALLVSDADDVLTDCVGGCPRNVLLISRDEALGDAALALGAGLTIALCLVAVGMLVRQWLAASAPERRSLVPMFLGGGVMLGLIAAYAVTGVEAVLWMAFAAFAATRRRNHRRRNPTRSGARPTRRAPRVLYRWVVDL